MQFDLDFSGRLPVSAQLGMKQADDNASEKFKHIWDGCVLAAARRLPELTSDDVLTEYEKLKFPPKTHNMAAIGPAMQRARIMGILKSTNQVKRSERPGKHGNRQNLYISNYYEAKL